MGGAISFTPHTCIFFPPEKCLTWQNSCFGVHIMVTAGEKMCVWSILNYWMLNTCVWPVIISITYTNNCHRHFIAKFLALYVGDCISTYKILILHGLLSVM
jgi:hypothetical protein